MLRITQRPPTYSGLDWFSALLTLLAVLLILPLPLRAQNSTPQTDQATLNQAQSIPPPPAPDATMQSALRLSDVTGNVQVFRGDLLAFPQAFVNMPIVEGMRIVAGSSGRAEIQFDDGSVARLAPNSSLLIASLSSTGDGISTARINALTGLTYYEFSTQGSQYTVGVGPETVVPQNNAVLRVDMDNVPWQVADMQGDLQLFNGNDLITALQSGDNVTFDPANPSGFQLSQSIPPNSWDQWNANRDATLAQLASGSDQTDSSSDSAWNELNYYGDWYNVPGYGEGWAPSGVSEDWDPYGSGWWGYYPASGYTWISGYPWGWWPYHCGDWNWFDGYGWVWFPGNCGWGGATGGWYSAAPILSAPPNYHRLIRPPRTSHAPQHRVPRVYAVHRGHSPVHFRTIGRAKPGPRRFPLGGQNLQPVQAVLPAMQYAPVPGEINSREYNTVTAQRGGSASQPGRSTPIRAPYRVNPGNPSHGDFHSGHNSGFTPGRQPSFHPAPRPAPRPAPVFHPALRPAPMPRPAPVFHSAPRPAPQPSARPRR